MVKGFLSNLKSKLHKTFDSFFHDSNPTRPKINFIISQQFLSCFLIVPTAQLQKLEVTILSDFPFVERCYPACFLGERQLFKKRKQI